MNSERVVRLFGEAEFHDWAGLLAKTSLHSATDSYVRAAMAQAAREVLDNRSRLPDGL